VRRLCPRSRGMLVVHLVVCSVSVACTAKQQAARAMDASPCEGTRTVVVHNGTPRSLEVVLSSGGVSMGRVIEVLEPGQQSKAIPLPSSGPYVHARDQATGQIVGPREDARLRYEYVCDSGS
jgi:hypothetical protein